MNEEFKMLKRWVEECPVEAAMRIEELERKLNCYKKALTAIIKKGTYGVDVETEKIIRSEEAEIAYVALFES